MFKFIFEILTDPLGLPIEWYWEYLILAVIGVVAYAVAYRCVGDMYSGGMIDGSTSGSFFHWLIRLILFVVLWDKLNLMRLRCQSLMQIMMILH